MSLEPIPPVSSPSNIKEYEAGQVIGHLFRNPESLDGRADSDSIVNQVALDCAIQKGSGLRICSAIPVPGHHTLYKHADGHPDLETVQLTSISTQYKIEAIPVFVVDMAKIRAERELVRQSADSELP